MHVSNAVFAVPEKNIIAVSKACQRIFRNMYAWQPNMPLAVMNFDSQMPPHSTHTHTHVDK